MRLFDVQVRLKLMKVPRNSNFSSWMETSAALFYEIFHQANFVEKQMEIHEDPLPRFFELWCDTCLSTMYWILESSKSGIQRKSTMPPEFGACTKIFLLVKEDTVSLIQSNLAMSSKNYVKYITRGRRKTAETGHSSYRVKSAHQLNSLKYLHRSISQLDFGPGDPPGRKWLHLNARKSQSNTRHITASVRW